MITTLILNTFSSTKVIAGETKGIVSSSAPLTAYANEETKCEENT